MDKGVVPIAPVAPSTHHHGSMCNCLLPHLITLRSGSVVMEELEIGEDTPIQLIELYIK